MIECGVRETMPERLVLPDRDAPDWAVFFERIANRSVSGAFDRLLKGPDPRGQQRIDRVFLDGSVTVDIYGAVLYAIGAVGHRTGIRLQELAKILEATVEVPPTTQQIAGTLNHMRDIAFRNRGTSDPVLDFKDGEVHVLDPFLAFYLHHGSWFDRAVPRV